MNENSSSQYLNLLRNHIDITHVPFSDRGSRLLVYKHSDKNRLFIKFAERLTGLEADLDAYLRRPPFIRELSFVDTDGKPLDFEMATSPYALFFHTQIGEFGIVFQDGRTLSIGLPPKTTAGVKFHVHPQFWQNTQNGGELKSVRNLAYATDGKIFRNHISPDEGGYQVEFIVQGGKDCTITLHISPVLDMWHELVPFSSSITKAEERWRAWFAKVPPVAEPYQLTYAYAWWIMANNLISPMGKVAYEAMTPSKKNYVGLWLWDSALHALAYRHVDPDLARNQIRAMLAYQLPDGMLPDAVYDEGVVTEIDHPIQAEVTKPPIVAWAALKLHETAPDSDFLQEIYIPLVRWNAWWFSMNDDDVDGLAQYNHPYSSGLDNNPLWDYGMPVESPDLNTYLCVQMGSLALIAETLGLKEEGKMWRRRASSLVRRMIEAFWDEENGIFRALHNEEPIPVITPFNLYPLWTGQLPDVIRNRLLNHLRNPDEFWGDLMIPSVARNDPTYDPDAMWRGPIWININYFFVEALHQLGEHALAQELREKTLQIVMRSASIYEYYNGNTGEPAQNAANIFGWSAAAFIDLALQATAALEAQEK